MKNIATNNFNCLQDGPAHRSRKSENIRAVFLVVCMLLISDPVTADDTRDQLDPVAALLSDISSTPAHPNAVVLEHNWKPGCKTANPNNMRISIPDTFTARTLYPLNLLAQTERKKPARSEPNLVRRPNSETGKKLWNTKISALPETEENQSRRRLSLMVARLRSLELNKPTEPNESSGSAKSDTLYDDDDQDQKGNSKQVETQPETGSAKNPDTNQPPRQQPPGYTIGERALKIIAQLTEEPNRVDKPFKLAEILFQGGRFTEASVFYKAALTRNKADNSQSARDRAWMLYQLGNCLKVSDPNAARNAYRRLLAEYPNCPWAQPAKAQEELLAWQYDKKPYKLLTETENLYASQGVSKSD